MGVEGEGRTPEATVSEQTTALSDSFAERPSAPAGDSAFPIPPTAQSVGFTISSLGYAVSSRFLQTLAPLGLEPKEFALMRAVSVAEGQTQQAIAASLHVPASRMVAFVDALEVRGLIERRQTPRDRRARELHLTPRGIELLDSAFARAAALELELCAGLSMAEREQLLELLQRVGVALGVPAGVHAAAGHTDPAPHGEHPAPLA
jgi:DNA-binding MarR family transcriptional regulator